MRYRAEIDGLRAFAVLPVILFHAGLHGLGGGFVGVDVFFVISGYLITTIILDDMDRGTFSVAKFYERRARRILPALFVVVLACLPFAWFWFMSRDLKDFYQSVAAVSLFSSNVLFWQESGYFDTAGELKPLLHTWSLAVEEQYYILFPLLLLATWRLGKGSVLAILILLFVMSLGFAHWGTHNYPDAAFYLLPTRGWEILAGALVAVHSRAGPPICGARINQLASLLGVLLIVYAVVVFDSRTPFPGLFALAPVCGTVLIILFATKGTLINSILSTRALVHIGLISYSAYLWHYPLLAFARYQSGLELAPQATLVLVAATFALAHLSWRYVETPFRKREVVGSRRVLHFGALGGCFLLAFGVLGNFAISLEEDPLFSAPHRSAYNGSPSVLLLGDSHAGHLAHGLREKLGTRVIERASAGCIPLFGVDRYDRKRRPGVCAETMTGALLDFSTRHDLQTIVLAMMGPVYLDGVSFDGVWDPRTEEQVVVLAEDHSVTDPWRIFEIALNDTFSRLTLARKTVVFVLDVPEQNAMIRFCDPEGEFGVEGWLRRPARRHCFVPRNDFDHRNRRYHALVRQVASKHPSVKVFDPTDLFCDSTVCSAIDGGRLLYADSDHLSKFGSLFVAAELAPIILETVAE